MKVNIKHIEKKQGFLSKRPFYGIELIVQFSEEEQAIIYERSLQSVVLMDRDIPPDVNATSHRNRGLAEKLLTAAVSGADANHFHLTFGKLLRGPDVYFFSSPIEAKNYEMELREDILPAAKEYLVNNKEVGQETSFEL